jgi:hypothetical protein
MVIEAIMELVKKCHRYRQAGCHLHAEPADKTISYRNSYKVPLFESPEEAVRALSVSYRQLPIR